jgi:hypothetical protein
MWKSRDRMYDKKKMNEWKKEWKKERKKRKGEKYEYVQKIKWTPRFSKVH